MAYARGGKEESWNFVFAGAATSGFLRLRQGAVTAGRDALWSAAFFALAEGASLAIHRALDDLPPADGRRGLAARAPVGRPRRLPASPGFPGQLIVVKEVAVADNEDDSGFSDGFFAEERHASQAQLSLLRAPIMASPSPPRPDERDTDLPLPSPPRKPYPGFILDDAGGGFLIGGGVGSAYHAARGLLGSSSGHRLAGAARAVRANAPRISATWAARCGLYGAFKCALSLPRATDGDPVVSVLAAGAAGAAHCLRRGPLAVGRGALVGAASMAVIERADAALDNLRSWVHYHRRLVPEEDIDGGGGSDPKPDDEPPIGFLGVPPKPVVVEEVPAG
uniref:Mitochondrial import inner membrane translocase subunit Tim17 family protein n=3 Tax=Oryza TaxID=4527 RepID=Q75IW5_ORYSJ|nr:hypothetical protein [Oryza sativa Japonica Group]ABF96614.1 Mitochondrial import inner membrane translocase subunit Tim17 family protein [Oryza sativa Japonica Group]